MNALAIALGNIGSEAGRAWHWKNKNESALMEASRDRALALLDNLISTHASSPQRRELKRLREVFLDSLYGEKLFGHSIQPLEEYFLQFALAARRLRPTD